MSRINSANLKFAIITAIALLGSAGIIAGLTPVAVSGAARQSERLTKAGVAASGGEAEVNFRLATWLNPNNQAAYAGLAHAQILNGHANEAFASLAKAGQGSNTDQLKVRTLLELGRIREAAAASGTLAAAGRPDEDLLLAAATAALAGQPADPGLAGRLSSPEAAQRLVRLQTGQLPLAAELYATGLLQSSSAILQALPVSFERNLLLARIRYDRHTQTDLSLAEGLLTTAVNLKPSDIEARELLALTYRDTGQVAAAQAQQALVSQLRLGQP